MPEDVLSGAYRLATQIHESMQRLGHESSLIGCENLSKFINSLSENTAHTCILLHSNCSTELLELLAVRSKRGAFRTLAIGHNPAVDNVPLYVTHARSIIGVSKYVINSYIKFGIKNILPNPLYAPIAAEASTLNQTIRPGALTSWNHRKPRDIVLSAMEAVRCYRQAPARSYDWSNSNRLKLGIVSRLARLKRFPELLAKMLPSLESEISIDLHIFGMGSWREIEKIKSVIVPIRNRCYFWGWQKNAASCYRQLDALLVGLPKYEALGLNALESAGFGCPVLALREPPFSEVLIDQKTGWFYEHFDRDASGAFSELLHYLALYRPKISEQSKSEHLEKFSFSAFDMRLDALLKSHVTES